MSSVKFASKLLNSHHYFEGKISSQWNSFICTNSGKWIATHEESVFEKFRDIVTATQYIIDDNWGGLRNSIRIIDSPTYFMIYPILVVQNKLDEASIVSNSVVFVESKHVRHIQSIVSSGAKQRHFIVDIVTEDYLGLFLNELLLEYSFIHSFLSVNERRYIAAFKKWLKNVKVTVFI